MSKHVLGNLFAVCSLSPVSSVPGGYVLYSSLPVDVTSSGCVSDDSRYCSLIGAPDGLRSYELMRALSDCRPYSYQWLTYLWEV